MTQYEYKVVPAPRRGEKAKGVKTPEARFAKAVESLMNEMAAEGWEYQRAELLPSDERQGLTGSTTQWRNVLVFRRARSGALEAFSPRPLATSEAPTSEAEAKTEPQAATTAQAPDAAEGTETAGRQAS